MLSVFFFQAEDGIRALTVTGVQTCALPISARQSDGVAGTAAGARRIRQRYRARRRVARSEERRVGKECRRRWSARHETKSRTEAGSLAQARRPARSIPGVPPARLFAHLRCV